MNFDDLTRIVCVGTRPVGFPKRFAPFGNEAIHDSPHANRLKINMLSENEAFYTR